MKRDKTLTRLEDKINNQAATIDYLYALLSMIYKRIDACENSIDTIWDQVLDRGRGRKTN
jgi:uncharacterized coiled-coil protein SlyX